MAFLATHLTSFTTLLINDYALNIKYKRDDDRDKPSTNSAAWQKRLKYKIRFAPLLREKQPHGFNYHLENDCSANYFHLAPLA